jgi:hypothetical protein
MSGAPPSFDEFGQGLGDAPETPAVKPWSDIESSESYRGLTEGKRRAVRERYFNDYGLPNLRVKKPDATPELVEDLRRKFVEGRAEVEKTRAGLRPGDLADADYRSGASYSSLVDYGRAENDKERTLALESTYGKGNVFMDPAGRFMVKTPDGKTVAAEGANPGAQTRASLAQTQADLPEILGGAAAGLLWPPSRLAPIAQTGLRSVLPRTVRLGERVAQSVPSGLGSMAGESANEAYKGLRGQLAPEPNDVFKRPLTAFAGGLFGDLAFRGVSAAARHSILERYSRSATQNEKDLADRALREGFLPSVSQARMESSGGPITAASLGFYRFGQSLSNMIFKHGTNRDKINQQATALKLRGYLDDLGVPDSEKVGFLQRVFEKDSELARIVDDVGMPEHQKYAKLAQLRTDAIAEAKRLHDVEMGRIEQTAGVTRQQDKRNLARGVAGVERGLVTQAGLPSLAYPEGILAEEVNQQILGRRTALANLAAEEYERVWSMSGLNGSTRGLKDEALRHWEIIAKTQDEQTSPRFTVQLPGADPYEMRDGAEEGLGTPVAKPLDALRGQVDRILSAPDELSLQELARLRTDFNNMAGDDLTPAPLKGAYRDFAQSIGRSLDDLARGGDPAARELAQVNQWYAGEISRFDRLSMKRLAQEAGEGGLKAEQFAGLIIDPRSPTTTFEMREMLGPETFRRVAAQRFSEMIEPTIDPTTRQIDPARFVQAFKPYFDKQGQDFVGEVFGPDAARALQRLYQDAGTLKALDPKAFMSGDFKGAIEAAEHNARLLDSYWSQNFLGALATGGKEMEQALERVGDLSTLGEIRMAKMHFGEQSPQWEHLRQFAMQRLLARSVQTPASTADTGMMTGTGMKEVLNGIGDDKLREMFGPEMTADLRHLAQTIQYVTQKGENPLAGALAAGTLMFHPIANLGWLGRTWAEGWLMSKPGFIKWITLGLEGNSEAAQMVQGATRLLAQSWGQRTARATQTEGPAPGAAVSNAIRSGAQLPRFSQQ